MNQGIRYINPMSDYGFKKIFGDEQVMKEFLCDILKLETPITKITFIDKEMKSESAKIRGLIYDIRCETEDGNKFIVEMQNDFQINFADRIIYYLSRAFSSQALYGQNWNYELDAVYGIFFMNFHLKGLKSNHVRKIQLKVNDTEELFSDKIRIYTFELPDYRHMKESECNNKTDYWLYNIANMENMNNNLSFEKEQPIFKRIRNIADLVNLTPEELDRYNVSIDCYRSNLAIMQTNRAEGRAEGLEEGLEKGLEKGRAEERKTIIKRMRDKGLSDEQIQELIGD